MPGFSRILVLGAHSRLGSALVAQNWPTGCFVLPATRDQLDIRDSRSVVSYLDRWRPQVIINTTGWADIDGAEKFPDEAYELNHLAVGRLARSAQSIGARLVHLSSDFVFAGNGRGWYREGDPARPVNVYGQSKRAGEREVLELDDSVVIRTSGLISPSRLSLFDRVRRLSSTSTRIEVDDSHRFCPTSADELARAIVVAVAAGLRHTGIFHVAGADGATWADMARHLLTLRGLRDRIEVVPLGEQPETRAVRPIDTRLSSEAFAAAYSVCLSPWQETLERSWKEAEAHGAGYGSCPVGPISDRGENYPR